MATAEPGGAVHKGTWSLGLESGERWEGEQKFGSSTFGVWEFTGMGSPFRCSYGFNGWLFSGGIVRIRDIPIRGFPSAMGLKGLDTFSVRGSAHIPAFLDSTWPEESPRSEDSPPPAEGLDRICDMWNFCINRHNGHINGLYLDWSVRKIGIKELWTLKWDRNFDTAGSWTRAGGVRPEDWPEWMKNFRDY
jgi:prepilin-type processing-associated H-X9-DG protein